MAGSSVVVVPAGFEKRPADRAAFATCWLVDAAMGLVMGLGVTVFLGGLLTPFSVHPGGPGELGEMSAWAVSLAVAAGCAVAVGCMAFGTGGRSVGHMVAEIRVGRPDEPAEPGETYVDPIVLVAAGPARRAVRAGAPVAVFLAVAWYSVPLGALTVLLLWLPALLRADRRGPFERLAGVADVSLEPVR